MEVVIASSPVDGGIGCWDLQTGVEQLRYKSCASTPHGLVSVGKHFIACSQSRQPSATSGSVLYWSWSKPQVEVKSFPAEPIGPLASNYEGTYIVGGGLSGEIYLWEVMTGRLLKKWHAHYGAVTCLEFSKDCSLLISGSQDGCVRIWSLIRILDDEWSEQATHLYEYSFTEHTLPVTDIVIGYGGWNAIIVSASVDKTCKVWSLSRARLMRNIVFPSIIDAIELDPGEHVFYAGGRDGKIYIAALNAECNSRSNYGMNILGVLSDQSKSVTCLAYGANGNLLVSGSEDGMVRVWDTRNHNILRMFKHGKGPVNNVVIVTRPLWNPGMTPSIQASSRRQGSSLPPPLNRNVNPDDETDCVVVLELGATSGKIPDISYCSSRVLKEQIRELQQQGSTASADMELERLKHECKQSAQLLQQWKKMYENLHQFCVNELLDGDHVRGPNANSS